MVKATDLRIGNWIMGAYPFQIEEIKKDGIYDIYDPIPLTPGILEQCGFESTEDSYNEFKKDNWIVDFSIHSGIISFCGFRVIDKNEHDDPVWVHQFQNLFYSLCGEELQITLKEKAAV